MDNICKNQQGTAILLALIILIMLMLLTFGFIALTTVETTMAHNERDYIRSLYAAEAGISEALYRTNCRKNDTVTVNGETFYPYIAPFTLTNDRGTENPIDDLYWHNDRVDNNGNGLVDEWGELDPTWSANVWLAIPDELPDTPENTSTRKYYYYPTILELLSSPGGDILKYSSKVVEDFTLSYRYKKFPNGKIVFRDKDGEFEQPATHDKLGAAVVIIESVGQWSTLQRKLRVEAYTNIKTVFDMAMCGCSEVTITGTGTIIDSYNSAESSYQTGLGEKGDVGSNLSIDVSGSPAINGSMTAGTNINAGNSTVTGDGEAGNQINNGTFEGDIEQNVVPAPMPCPCEDLRLDIDMDYFELNNDNSLIGLTDLGQDPYRGTPYHLDLRNKDNLTLPAGTYYFDSISIGSQCTLTTTGEVIIYLRESSDLTGGGVINTAQKPTDLTIFSTAEIIDIGGNAAFYGALYAPGADIAVHGTSEYYGAFLGNIIDKVGNAGFHYDEALGQKSRKYFAELKKLSWREIR